MGEPILVAPGLVVLAVVETDQMDQAQLEEQMGLVVAVAVEATITGQARLVVQE